ncbi:MAG: hypothetical protein C0434_11740 [Xanthomonadaceae bacterium]|nr:hypothetical protein [Xanthomonadaceae bacterium]
MRLNPTLLRPSLSLLLAASIAAALPAAHADAALNLATSSYTETADGALLLNAEPVRLSHVPTLVASDCIKVESGGLARQRDRTQLVNTCAHAVKLSYCIASDGNGNGAMRCDRIGRRGFEAATIAAGKRLTVATTVPVDADIRWVACRAGEHHYSTLIDDGTRGECLVAEGPTAIAAADPR